MQIPFSMLKTSGGSKVAALLAVLAGMYILAAIKQQQRATANAPRP